MNTQYEPMDFDPSQSMQAHDVEMRYCLDYDMKFIDFHAHPFYELYFFREGTC